VSKHITISRAEDVDDLATRNSSRPTLMAPIDATQKEQMTLFTRDSDFVVGIKADAKW
jgi:hypothetical protein